MSILRGQLTKNATKYTISTVISTSSHQPIETLVNTNLILKCLFKPKKSYFVYLTGQVQETSNLIFTEREVVVNNVLEVDGVKYRIVEATPLKGPGARGRKTLGFSSRVEIFRH